MDTILVIDFGSHLIDHIPKKLQQIKICYEVVKYDNILNQIDKLISENNTQHTIIGIILSGSPESAYNTKTHFISETIFQANIPILGICYGMQIMAQQLGGKVIKSTSPEYGNACVYVYENSKLLHNIYDNIIDGVPIINVFMHHSDQVCHVPMGFNITASTINCPIASMENEAKKLYGVQFHPEAENIPYDKNGTVVIKQFVQICKNNKKNLYTT